MTSSEEQATTVAADEGIQQIPVVINASHGPAADDAQDALLRAISQEAQLVADKFPGQASKALQELAHAYALVTAGIPAAGDITPTVGATSRSIHGAVQNRFESNIR